MVALVACCVRLSMTSALITSTSISLMNRLMTSFRRAFFSHFWVQIVLLHYFPEAWTTHDLLFDHFNPLVGVTGDRAMNQLSRHFLFFDQNGSRRFECGRP
jgi:hypothetical protein